MSDPVLDLLIKKNLAFNVSGKDYLIKCLNSKHEDNNPSFRVDKLSGIAHCFGCGFKTNIFTHFGLANNFVSIKVDSSND
jgi:DNA primase